MNFLQWFKTLVGWIRGYTATQEQPPVVLETHQSELVKANLIYDSTTGQYPGIVSAWQLIPQAETLGRYLAPVLHEHQVNPAWLAINLGIDTEELDRLLSGEIHPDEHQLFFISRRFGLPMGRLRSCTSAPNDLLLLCANIAQWREEVGKLNLGSEEWRREFERRSRVELQAQRDILGTHLFMTGWLSKQPVRQRVVDGKTQHYKHLSAGATLLVDLQGEASRFIGYNHYAEKVMRAVALRAMLTTPTTLNSWEEIFQSLDNPKNQHNWRSWLEHYAQRLIKKDHILQPRRMR